MDKDFVGYSHPANIVYVSDYYVGDLLKKGQFYNNLQSAINEAQVGATVISYNIPEAYTKRNGIGVVFMRNGSTPRVWEGLLLQSGTTAPTVTRELRNDFGIRTRTTHLYDGVGRYTLLFTSPVIDPANNTGLVTQKMRVHSCPISATPSNKSRGFIIGHDTGHSSSSFAFYVCDRDGNVLNNLLNDGNGNGVYFRCEIRDSIIPITP